MVWTQESYHTSVNYVRPGECSPEKDRLWCHWLTVRQAEQKSSSESSLMSSQVLTLMMTSAQVVETSVNVTTNSLSQDYTHPDDHNLPTYVFQELLTSALRQSIKLLCFDYDDNTKYSCIMQQQGSQKRPVLRLKTTVLGPVARPEF